MSFFKRQTNFPTHLVLILSLPFIFGACPREDIPRNPRVAVKRSSPTPNDPRTGASFNGERAMDHVRRQIEIGPRPPDTVALSKTRSYIIDQLKSYGLT